MVTLTVAVIDGPYDSAGLSAVLARAPINLGSVSCDVNQTGACSHGTFIMGLLGARRDAVIPGLCSNCRLLHIPLFVDECAPTASIGELAQAIRIAVAAGARLINLSLAILGDGWQFDRELAAALNYAEENDTVIVVAAGNQGQLAIGQLLSHPATIPVVAIDAAHRPLPDSNFGPAIMRGGIAALGRHVVGYAPGGGTTVMSGTSVATAVATGTLAELWATRPEATAADIRAAVTRLGPRDGSIPPIIDREIILTALAHTHTPTVGLTAAMRDGNSNYASLQGEVVMKDDPRRLTRAFERAGESAAASTNVVSPAHGPGGCACGAPGGVCTCNGNSSSESGFVYAIGTVEAEYPNVAIEREMQIMADHLGIKLSANNDAATKPTEDRGWQFEVLSKDRKQTRYIARQLTWRLTIEDFPAFVLTPRDPSDLDDLIECLGRAKYPRSGNDKGKGGTKGKPTLLDPPYGPAQDLDVVVGVRGAQTPEGIEVLVDQIFTIPPERLAPRGHSYFAQLSDNYGLTDEDRAYNFLAARYTLPSEYFEETSKEFALADVPVIYSKLGGSSGRVVRVIFTLRSTKSAAEKKYFVRVDVTHEFPIIINPWQQYLG
jgi:Subtilase family/PatG C-terminal/PatG Domain